MTLKQDIKKTSVFWLIGSNLLLLAFAFIFEWKMYDVMVIFWFETFVIGAVNILKMIKAPYNEKFGKKTLKQLPNTEETGDLGKLAFYLIKLFAIQGFIIMYIGFVLIAGFTINRIFAYTAQSSSASIFEFAIADKWSFIIACFAISASHMTSYVTNYIRREEYKNATPKKLLFAPFRRLLLVWIVILVGGYLLLDFGAESMLLLIPYFIAKITIDIRQHIKEHKQAQSAPDNNS